MKKKFTTIDVITIVSELIDEVVGLRVNQIYDIDHKTYLIKLQKPEKKVVLLLESAARIHTTEYEWPKSPAPSGFAMKLRKHLRNKRLESIEQLGVDRVVDLCFGSGDVAHHLFVEMYDKGNIILTDGEYNILNVLRPRKDGEDTRIAVREKYAVENARKARDPPTIDAIRETLREAKDNLPLKKVLNPLLDCGIGVLEDELLKVNISPTAKVGKDIILEGDLEKIFAAVSCAQSAVHQILEKGTQQGFIIKKVVQRPSVDGGWEESFLYEEFHPRLYIQHAHLPHDTCSSFNKACDEFFSKLESNELDKKAMQKEKEALKKLENVKKDHERRIQELKGKQEEDMRKGQLIELNQQLVEGALLVVRSAIANQIDWRHIQELLDEAQARKDPIACAIRALKLETNTMTLWLSDPYDRDENDMLLDSDEEREEGTESNKMRPMAVDINLDDSALANARRYFSMRRLAAKKEQKTLDASSKAIKSAEKKTQQTLREVSAITSINKARKIHWFEKYLWFISSENYLVLGGRDSQQNEQVVKRHLRPKDIFVHADLHGASSIVIKNPTGALVPPRTLHEAGVMALCYSRAWDEKVVTSAWWVWGQQVSKTAPAGEYLTTGSFMVRGKKNFLPPSHLVYGFGFLFRLEESSIHRHEGERKVRLQDNELTSAITEALEKLAVDSSEVKDEEELSLDDDIEDDKKHGETEELSDDEDNEATNLGDIEEEDEALGREGGDEEVHTEDVEVERGERTEEGDNQEADFPDIEVEMSYIMRDKFTLKPKTSNVDIRPDESRMVFLGDDKPVIIEDAQKLKGAKLRKAADVDKDSNNESIKGPQMKRRQKGKMKKMRKYKDQDEQERELRMQLLQSAGTKKPPKKKAKSLKAERKPVHSLSRPLKEETKRPVVNDEDEIEGDEELTQVADDLSILDALTAVPLPDDELLYVLPVCAPYTAMTNYKLKVKLTPGPGKKGKATKTALNLFVSDKTTTSREKDLLRAVKDHDLARNLPGKVKVSAPNITKIKK